MKPDFCYPRSCRGGGVLRRLLCGAAWGEALGSRKRACRDCCRVMQRVGRSLLERVPVRFFFFTRNSEKSGRGFQLVQCVCWPLCVAGKNPCLLGLGLSLARFRFSAPCWRV